MAEDRPWTGLPPARALWLLLVRQGSRDGFQAFLDRYGDRFEPGTMAAVLAAQGLQARIARISMDDLACLWWPTLAELDDGSWIILDDGRSGRYRIEAAEGRRDLAAADLGSRLSGRVFDLVPAHTAGASPWDFLKPLLRRSRSDLVQIAGATVVVQMLALATPAITAVVLNRALPDGAPALLGLVVAGLALVTVHLAWITWLRDRMLAHLRIRLEAAAGRSYLDHVLRLPYPFLQGRTLGDLLQACSAVAAIQNQLPMNVATGCLDLLMGLFYLVALVVLWPGPGLLAALVTGIMAVGALAAGRMAAQLETRRLEARVKEEGLMIELVGGIATLKAAGAEAQGLARWRTCFRDVLALERTRGRIGLGTTTGLGGLSQALALGLFTLGGLRLLDGALTIGRLFAFLQMTSGLLASAMSFVQALLTLMVLRPQLARTRELLEQEAEPRPPPIPSPAAQARVALEGVWFRYGEASPWVLQDYHLELEPGRKTALAGPSGFGKTTVLRLLAGLHQPVRGSILINGAPATEGRHSLVYLPQFVRVFGGSLLDNLRIFSCGAPLADLLAMARNTGLQALVDSLPMGYQTLLPPGGRNLSGGQRQLLAITGALASGRPLLLLDEALANLDPHLGAAIQDLIEAGPWTVVSASHAPSRADRSG